MDGSGLTYCCEVLQKNNGGGFFVRVAKRLHFLKFAFFDGAFRFFSRH